MCKGPSRWRAAQGEDLRGQRQLAKLRRVNARDPRSLAGDNVIRPFAIVTSLVGNRRVIRRSSHGGAELNPTGALARSRRPLG